MRPTTKTILMLVCLVPMFALIAYGGHQTSSFPVAPGSSVFIDQMDGFGPQLEKAFLNGGVPLLIVSNKGSADFEIVGGIQDAKEPTSVVPRRPRSITVKIVNLRSGDLAWGYGVSVMTDLPAAAESCAKQMKGEMKKRGR
jgi:hypothetical protein